MENIEFFLLFMAYVCIWTLIYALSLVGVVKISNCITKDEDINGTIFVMFWAIGGLTLPIVAINLMDDIVLWINNPWLSNICMEKVLF